MPSVEFVRTARPRWRRTGDARFPVAARVAGKWWVLRINPFPDHDLWTLFVDGAARFDLTAVPESWGEPSQTRRRLWPGRARRVLRPVRGFAVYGSEVGEPCDNPFCCG
ncbi:hypothetical protein [Nocardia farcinica]|uniref:hypothetical protein n=1 Tax=Nocardia farcinica TaxID=37329 RepID=UPI0024554648|nr:hypothetical protein [Nocardia farcinica]